MWLTHSNSLHETRHPVNSEAPQCGMYDPVDSEAPQCGMYDPVNSEAPQRGMFHHIDPNTEASD
jgi:hypothetical protein